MQVIQFLYVLILFVAFSAQFNGNEFAAQEATTLHQAFITVGQVRKEIDRILDLTGRERGQFDAVLNNLKSAQRHLSNAINELNAI